jgi:hypothetical protein
MEIWITGGAIMTTLLFMARQLGSMNTKLKVLCGMTHDQETRLREVERSVPRQ